MTAKLSRRFYDQLGDDVANELVEWFNQVDATYRMDLREHTDLLFARFDARLEQRVSRLEHQIGRLEERMTTTLRWMFLFWTTTTAALVGIALR